MRPGPEGPGYISPLPVYTFTVNPSMRPGPEGPGYEGFHLGPEPNEFILQ